MSRADSHEFARAIAAAFRQSHEGRSTDDVVIDDRLDHKFLDACAPLLPGVPPAELNWRLLNVRKSGKLGRVTSRQARIVDYEGFIHAAEIAARWMEDKYGLTCDRILCDPERRTEFDDIAVSIVPGHTPYEYRKAALKLRKARQLKPEPMKRLDAFKAKVVMQHAAAYEKHPELIPASSGIYAFLDDTGYLYIGESDNLRVRLKKHLDHSDNRTLAHYLWKHGTGSVKLELFVFPEGSEGTRARSRRAFEAALIASRAPRFNIKRHP